MDNCGGRECYVNLRDLRFDIIKDFNGKYSIAKHWAYRSLLNKVDIAFYSQIR